LLKTKKQNLKTLKPVTIHKGVRRMTKFFYCQKCKIICEEKFCPKCGTYLSARKSRKYETSFWLQLLKSRIIKTLIEKGKPLYTISTTSELAKKLG